MTYGLIQLSWLLSRVNLIESLIFFKQFEQFLVDVLARFLNHELLDIWQRNKLWVSHEPVISQLVPVGIESTVVSISDSQGVILFVQEWKCKPVTLEHVINVETFLTFILDKEKISTVDRVHNSVICLKTPRYSEWLIWESRCVFKSISIYGFEVVLFVLRGFIPAHRIDKSWSHRWWNHKVLDGCQKWLEHFFERLC